VLVERFPLEPYRPHLIYVSPEAKGEKVYAISGSAYINFPVSRMEIYPDFSENPRELRKITGTIDSVRSDKDVTIQSILIKGFASPESPYSNNERLAKGRTKSLREYVENLYHFENGFIQTAYEPEDWAGLERLVANSNLKHKEEILATIHSEREPDNKEWWIKSNWLEDYNYILKHFYPSLRRSDYTIEYTVRKYSSTKEIEQIMNSAPQKLSLEEFYLLAQTYEEGSDELDELWEVAVRMFPSDEIANLNAANSAMEKGDFERALRYLDKAGERAEAVYARGALEVLREDYVAAMPYLERAKELGIEEAQPTIDGITDHWKVSMAKKK
jgi:tetratricopeptide (TPR) repeat protein